MSSVPDFPKRIWMYWENRPGAKKPAYLQLCHKTIARHQGEFELMLLDETTVNDYINVPKKVWMLDEIAHRADFIRFQLLEKFGGVWLDADVILIQDISASVVPYIRDYDFVGYGRERGKPSINFMACRRDCELIKRHSQQMVEVLAQKKTGIFRKKLKLVWTEIGHDILWELARDYPYYHHDLRKVAPIFWKDWELFLRTDLEVGDYIKDDTLMVMLYNDFMFKHLKATGEKELLEGQTLLSKILRHALNQ